MKSRLTLLKKQTILLILLCIVSTGAVGLSAYNSARSSVMYEAKNNLSILTGATYKLIDTAVNISIRNYLAAIAESNLDIVRALNDDVVSGKISLEEAKAQAELILLSQHMGKTGYTYVLDTSGNLLVHPKLKGTNIIEYGFVQDQIHLKSGFLEYAWKNPDDPEPRLKVLYMTYFEPWDYIISVSSYKEEFKYLVNINDFKDNILSFKLGETGYMYVLDQNGTLVIHPKLQGTNIANSQDAEGRYFIKEILKNKNGSIIYPWKNPGESYPRDKIVVYMYYEPMNWYLCSGSYLDELYSPVKKIRQNVTVAVISVFAISLLISFYYRRILSDSFRKLTEAIGKTKEGQYAVVKEFNPKDELGQIIEVFNEMVTAAKTYQESLVETNGQLNRLNEALEIQVEVKANDLKCLELAQEKLKKSNEESYYNSMTDMLTALPNRRRLDEFLSLAIELSKRTRSPMSVMMADLDHFKAYNDNYGHPQGDVCLRIVANALDSTVRRSIDLVARYGGEEFVIVLPDTDSEGAALMAERLRSAVEGLALTHGFSEMANVVTVSIGYVTSGSSMDTATILIEKADRALYHAKRRCRNCCVQFAEETSGKIKEAMVVQA